MPSTRIVLLLALCFAPLSAETCSGNSCAAETQGPSMLQLPTKRLAKGQDAAMLEEEHEVDVAGSDADEHEDEEEHDEADEEAHDEEDEEEQDEEDSQQELEE